MLWWLTWSGVRRGAGDIPIRLGGSMHEVVVPGNKKEARDFNGRRHVLETAIAGDVAFVNAWKVDEVGNCQFRCVPRPASPLSGAFR